MEQILIRNLPEGTKARLKVSAKRHHRSLEAEARVLLSRALDNEPTTMVDLLADPDSDDTEFEPARLGLHGRAVDL